MPQHEAKTDSTNLSPTRPELPSGHRYINPVVTREDGTVILPTGENLERIVARLRTIGTPPAIYDALLYTYEHQLFKGITDNAWNATVTYYTTTTSIEALAKRAREEFRLNIGPKSLGSMQKLLSRTMQTISQTLHVHGITTFDEITLDQRKDMHAEAYQQHQREAVQQPEFRARQRDRIAQEAPDAPRRKASRQRMLEQRQQPEFLDRLEAGIRDPERGEKISASLQAKTEDLPSRRVLAYRMQEAKPVPKALQGLHDLSIDEQNVVMGKTLSTLQARPEGKKLLALLTTLTPEGFVRELTPRLQGFLLMVDVYNQVGLPIAPEQATIDHIRRTLGKPRTLQTMIQRLKKRKRIFAHVSQLADKRFGKQENYMDTSHRTTLTQPVLDRINANKAQFIFGAAFAYSLHTRTESMQHHIKHRTSTTPRPTT